MPRRFALIPAAGVGSRMGAPLPKQYLELAGKPMLAHCVATFLASPHIDHVFVVVSPEDEMIDTLGLKDERLTVLRTGGSTRQASVSQGLLAMRGMATDDDWVLVHDAARPGLDLDLLHRLIAALDQDSVGGLLALPLADAIKKADGQRVDCTVPRTGLWAAQTPQMFRLGALADALERASDVTDEASAMEALGLQPLLVPGSLRNMKVTRPEDLNLVQILMGVAA